MHSSFMITVGRVTNGEKFMSEINQAYLRRGLHWIAIEGERNFDKFNTANPFWYCHYLRKDFNPVKIIKKIFKENPKHIVYIKTGDGPDGKFFESKTGKVNYNKIKIKDFDAIDQLFYKNKIQGAKVYGKHFGAGNDWG